MTRRRLSLAMTCTFLAALALGGLPVPRTSARPGSPRPDGLRLNFQPYAGEGHERMPVEVLKFVVNPGSGGMWVHEWRLKNRSDKSVVKIGRALFVYSEDDPRTLLLRHALPDYEARLAPGRGWPRGECSGYYCPGGFAMLSADELLKPLAEGGEPQGAYRIALGIDKVWFADGTVWELEVAEVKAK